MNREYFGKIFGGPHHTTEAIVNTAGVYLIIPFIQTGAAQILDVGQADDLVCVLNDPDLQKSWHTLARNFGGFSMYIHYEINEFSRITLAHQIRTRYHLPDRQGKISTSES